MALYVVDNNISLQENKVQMSFEISENNIKVLDILFSEKLQIT